MKVNRFEFWSSIVPVERMKLSSRHIMYTGRKRWDDNCL